MLKNIEVRVRRSDHAQELYITARPAPGADAKCLFEQVAGVLREHNVFVLQERVFAQPSDVKNLRAARIAAFGDLVDGVEPTWLAVPPGAYGPIAGVQVHAVAGCTRPQVLSVDGEPCGRLATFLSNNTETGPERYLTGCNLQANVLDQKDQESLPADQAKGMLAKAESLLTQAGATFANVARTWMWLGKILDWYGEFNAVRNELFQARGLLASPAAKGRPSARIEAQDLLTREGNVVMPASTGIGIGPAVILDRVKKHCAMDFFASLGVPKMECLMAGGNQGSASKYGSAFSRAVVTKTPGGRTVYVSGTAAIDAAGHTTHLGDAAGQIADTIKNVRAVLKDGGCDQDDVVQTMVYCKTPQVERAFLDFLAKEAKEGDPLDPLLAKGVIVIADVCRDNLLFEIEATAMPRS